MNPIIILVVPILLCLFASETYAYIDPGTGSLVIQMLIGALVVTSLFFRGFWARVKNLFLRVFGGTRPSRKEVDPLKEMVANQSRRKSGVSKDTLSSKESENP